MKGTLHKLEKGWTVWYNEDPIGGNISFVDSLPLHPDDLDSEIVRWANNGSLDDKEVEFEIVIQEEGSRHYAKLTKANEYPELEGTNILCEDIINKKEAPYISDDFQIGLDGAYEHEDDDIVNN
jgi:hypothetical protein